MNICDIYGRFDGYFTAITLVSEIFQNHWNARSRELHYIINKSTEHVMTE